MQSAQSALHDPTHDHVVGALETDHLTLLDMKSARPSVTAPCLWCLTSCLRDARAKRCWLPIFNIFSPFGTSFKQRTSACYGKTHRPSHCFATTPSRQSPPRLSRYCPHEAKTAPIVLVPGQDKDIENFTKQCVGCQQSGKSLIRNSRATAETPHGRSPGEVMFNRPHRLPFQIPASAHRAQPPSPQMATSASDAQGLHSRGPYRVGDRVLARRPQVLKGQSPWGKPLAVLKVLGNWTYRLLDDQMWNARKLRRYWSLRRLFSTSMRPQPPL
ncbi:hypothetical protein PoB_001885600 [Plakobranchus ocellatus]|uniref:Uncharacterized protein n=1 Tax=Plakobranchus ocellatus TaxID=259542 RepID=A0AAV3ZCI1_9GAST|nr:hypothetical protein PoB_001885600 [Plakobranchus ocellatus]